MNYYSFKGLNILIIITIIKILIITKAQGCHVVYFDKEIINKNVTYIAIEVKTKYCFQDRRICNYVNRIPKTKTVEEFQLVPKRKCCTGYVEQENGECKPKCNNCENGKCIYTDFCVCNPGYRRNYLLNKCVSKCDNDCINSDCIGNNICECNKGYKFLNDSQNECIPDCLKGDHCLNGECSEPDKCNCNLGYQMNITTDICEPICSEPCINGICTGPNECTCNHGYTLKNDTQNICEPICSSGCPNGKCIDVNKCQCNVGYEESIEEIEQIDNNENTNISVQYLTKCEPICPDGCVNGYCTEPNICECHKGYKKLEAHQIKNNLTNLCIPVCENECINGNCIGPNQCECHNGYQHSNNNLMLCEPICENKCHNNGYCIEPNKCACKSGYLQVDDKCFSNCELTCLHGTCDNKHENCICSNGYAHPDQNNTLHCSPVCQPQCGNGGVCFKPNHCICHHGFEYSEKFKRCLTPCPDNAICNKYNDNNELIVTECIKGYGLNETTTNNKTICIPVCEKNCKNGICIGPNICQCLTGYDNNDENYNICEPICDPLCKYANCIEPNLCECINGYQKTNLVNECEPICPNSSCINGYCIGPNHCQCFNGYKLSENDNMICEPICNKPICNTNISKCVAPNVCDCLDGYEYPITNNNILLTNKTNGTIDFGIVADDITNSTCIPTCNNINCTFGICKSPNKCECFDGYTFDNSTTMCQPILGTTMNTNTEFSTLEEREPSRNISNILFRSLIIGSCLALLIIIAILITRRLKNRGQFNLTTSRFNLMNPVFETE